MRKELVSLDVIKGVSGQRRKQMSSLVSFSTWSWTVTKLSGVKNGNSKIIRRMSVLSVLGCHFLSAFDKFRRKRYFMGGISRKPSVRPFVWSTEL